MLQQLRQNKNEQNLKLWVFSSEEELGEELEEELQDRGSDSESLVALLCVLVRVSSYCLGGCTTLRPDAS